MSLRERVLLVLGFLGAIGLVVYPLAHRLSSADAAGGAAAVASVASVVHAATASAGATRSAAPTPRVTPVVTIEDAWLADAMRHRGREGAEYEYECPPHGVLGPIWGTKIYTDDTSVCTAAVHAGVITRAYGGTVTIIIRPGLDAYEGSVRSGIASQPYDRWDGSFEVVGS